MSTIRSVTSKPWSLRIALTARIRSKTRPSSSSSSSSAVSSATVTPSAPATAQPSRPPRSTITSSGSSSWPAARNRPPPSSSNSPACERLLHRAEILAELRPEHRQVRLHAQLRVDRVEHDLLHAHLVGDLVRVRLRARRALDDEPAERLAQLHRRRRARLVRERDDAAHVRDLLQQLPVRRRRLRPRREVHRLRRVRARARDEVPPEVLREERHDRREHAQRLDERVPERLQRSRVALPEPRARAADVPVREIVEVLLEVADHVDGQPRLVAGGRVGDERVRPLDEPAVERLRGRPPARATTRPAGTPRCSRTMTKNETEFQSVSSSRLIWSAARKPNRRFRSGGCAQYCQRITSAPIRANASLGLDRVARRAVHLAAVSRRASSRSRAPAGTARARSARPT